MDTFLVKFTQEEFFDFLNNQKEEINHVIKNF
ncbi:hypothetical protein C8D70_105124 [Chryseobacterium sp. CBTAP 102]|nr:hypothetical protein C8D70_105124 [Chryseobacterium sp. CBTAP 102]